MLLPIQYHTCRSLWKKRFWKSTCAFIPWQVSVLFLSLSLSLWFCSFTLLNGVLKSLPRHKLFTTAQPTKARKQINIRAGNGQLLPRTEWSDLSRYILRLFQYLSTSFRCVSKMQSSCWRGHTNHTTWRKTDPQSCSACQSLLFYLRSTFAR